MPTPKKKVAEKKGNIGRKPMFRDEAAVVAVMRAYSEKQRAEKEPVTLSGLGTKLLKQPLLFNTNIRVDKDSGAREERPYSAGALKQAVFRLVRKHHIWLSRNGKP